MTTTIGIDLGDYDPRLVKINANEVIAEIDSLPGHARAAIEATERQLEQKLLAAARAKADDDVLQVRTGRFLASIKGEVQATATSIIARVYSTDRKAHLLEYGADLPPREILPRKARAMHFDGVFAGRVAWPGARLAPHPTIHAAFAELEPEIVSELLEAIEQNVSLGEPLDPGESHAFGALGGFVPGGTTLLSAAVEDIFI